MCKERDAKRRQNEQDAARKKIVPVTPAPAPRPIAKPKAQVSFTKPLSYEELMNKAELNSKNTLSATDLKGNEGRIEKGLVKPELKRLNGPNPKIAPMKPQPCRSSLSSSNVKKPVKVIKRNMQPRTETSDLVTLNQKKRDLRSIEEIQMQLKDQQKKTQSQAAKSKKVVTEDADPETYYAKNYSSIISNLFGYDRNKYTGNDADDDDDQLLDMEADYRTQMAEESRSTRLGKQEDLKEELKEIERKKKKASLLK